MTKQTVIKREAQIKSLILIVRGQKVILDSDLASIYGVKTKRLNEAIKRNADRFPKDFAFRLTLQEAAELKTQPGISSSTMRSQIATASKRNIRYLPIAFTEHGAIMAATVLNSPHAVQMSLFVVRAFVKMRKLMGDTAVLAQQLAKLEKELKERLDIHEVAIVGILQRVMNLIDPPEIPPLPKKQIGFKVKEKVARYKIKKK
jgi:hypothetical protein